MVGPGQDIDGDGNVQIGGDGFVLDKVRESTIAGGNVTQNFTRNITQIIHGVPNEKHAEALARIAFLEAELKITEDSVDEAVPTQQEVLAAEDAIDAASDLEGMGAVIDPHDSIGLGKAAILQSRYHEAQFYFESALSSFQESEDSDGMAESMDNLAKVFRFFGNLEESRCILRLLKSIES